VFTVTGKPLSYQVLNTNPPLRTQGKYLLVQGKGSRKRC